jgi:peptidyl-prolyl cis-trans isomerase SurA
MNKGYKLFTGFMACLLLAGVSANARQTGRHAAANDTAVVAKEEPKAPESAVIDEVVWVVGDEPILKSDVEVMRMQGQAEGMKWAGDPDCSIPEQIAVQKLFLHQADLDSIEVSESDVTSSIDQQIDYWLQMTNGSKEKLEEYRGMSIAQMRQQMHDDFKNQQLITKMRQELVKDISVTPADVRKYFEKLPEDSVPYVPTEVEVEILTRQPKVSQDEINRVKEVLRSYTDRVTRGETTFATLARLYSEDPGTARQGGELGFTGRGTLDPAFANVAFNLTDPKKISKIVETEFGFHIIQLIDKRGDRVNVRHILLKPNVSQDAVDKAKQQLDSISNDIRAGKFSFEDAASFLSDDKDTRNNHGLMAYNDRQNQTLTSKFQMKNLPTEIAREVEGMKVGDISKPFEMVNNRGKKVCVIAKLKARIDGHRASITEDYQVMKDLVLAKKREEFIHNWVVDKIRHTYVRVNDRYKDCKFEYQGWVK